MSFLEISHMLMEDQDQSTLDSIFLSSFYKNISICVAFLIIYDFDSCSLN